MQQASSGGYSKKEEIANSVTHGIGALLGLAGLILLIIFSVIKGTTIHIVSSTIYGATLVILYSASTLYHSFPNPKIKKIFQKLDHASIFLLIAGTYTPFTLVSLKGGWGWSLFGIVWGLALVGIILELIPTKKRMKALSVSLYLAMGWLVVIAIKPMLESIETGGLVLLLIGGLAYSGGVVFYLWKSLPYSHAIWHIFVLAGSVTQFFAIFFFVLPW